MPVGEMITAGLIGNASYDAVKSFLQVSVPFLKNALKNKAQDWLFDDATAEKIAARVNELAYEDGESKEAYCQRLEADDTLNKLLASTINVDSSTNIQQTTSGSNAPAMTSTGSGDITYSQNHYYGANGEPPAKKD